MLMYQVKQWKLCLTIIWWWKQQRNIEKVNYGRCQENDQGERNRKKYHRAYQHWVVKERQNLKRTQKSSVDGNGSISREDICYLGKGEDSEWWNDEIRELNQMKKEAIDVFYRIVQTISVRTVEWGRRILNQLRKNRELFLGKVLSVWKGEVFHSMKDKIMELVKGREVGIIFCQFKCYRL